MVDVVVEVVIDRPLTLVAGYAANPSNAPECPFPMQTTYEWREVERTRTAMRLRDRGEPSGFGRVAALALAAAVRRSTTKRPAA